ncbi:MAG TPA: SpoIIE family protein phosphatase [bacterium]|nr:SpoIIE family protein phosphatase [bacterium]
MSAPRVLVVDDDPALLEALPETIRLRLPGTTVDTCISAAPALERIAAVDYDAIVSDIKMPGTDGLALLAQVRAARPDTPVLLITGHGEHDLAIRSLRAGAYDYVQKPIDRDYFAASLGRAVQVRQLRRQIGEQQAALARHAGRLEETVQERTTELRQTIEHLRALTDVAAAIHGAHEVEEVLRSVVDAACRLSDADLAVAGFYRGDGGPVAFADGERWQIAIAPHVASAGISDEVLTPMLAAICGEHRPGRLPETVLVPLAETRANGDGPLSSFLTLPIRGRSGHILGAMILARPAGAAFAPEARVHIEALALQLAVALENTLLYERARGTAETLQRSLMPERLPEIPGMALSARYLPGNQEAVGGDWYDVLTLPAGQIGLVIGDVAGRGVWAAAVMGQLRNAVRAYALEGNPPALIAERLTRLVDDRTMATLLYLIVDPETRTVRYLNLGHVPPLVVGPEGDVTQLDGGAPPLGVRGITYREETAALAPHSTILVCTDGLLEARRESIDEGLARVTAALAENGDAPIDGLVDRVLTAALEGRTAEDDVALVALRLAPLTPDRLQIRLPAVPASLAQMRQTLRRWLEAAEVKLEDAYDVTTAINEACANAIEHAYGPTDGTFECELSFAGDVLTAAVRDGGQWRPARGQYRGHGLKLMEALMGDVEVGSGPGGTVVQMRRRIAQRGRVRA